MLLDVCFVKVMTIVIVPWVVPPRKMKHAVLYPVTFWTYRLLTSWFSISILVVGGTRCRRWGRNQRLVGEQSISSHVNILASTITFHTPVPLSIVWVWVLIPPSKRQLSNFYVPQALKTPASSPGRHKAHLIPIYCTCLIIRHVKTLIGCLANTQANINIRSWALITIFYFMKSFLTRNIVSPHPTPTTKISDRNSLSPPPPPPEHSGPPFLNFETESCPLAWRKGLILCYPSPLLNMRGIPPVKPKQTCIKWLLSCALKGELCCMDCTRTIT